jgi:translation initiation factor eIF-2B subunit epsilon
VKLVGPTISCEGTPLDGDVKGVWRRNPHVQSYVVAMDSVGLKLLIDDGRVFQCHRWVVCFRGWGSVGELWVCVWA